ncbi:TIR domain-containing protein [Taibaiella koreensis]|uniref:TIR domain-containing protein n=1 Tax=Taibaiella koreensis TaxID=1268548 RepID=UPI000E59A8E0|nr:TIR domain-containing protein [Taibaiella koreensis]
MSRNPQKYDVALSFAEEDRDFVDKVARILQAKGIKCFYDDFERIGTWGEKLAEFMDSVYREEAFFCVVFLSEHYKRKYWTLYELDKAQLRSLFEKRSAYLLPFRLDGSVLEGVTDTRACLFYPKYDEQGLADAIYEKVEHNRSPWVLAYRRGLRFMWKHRFRLAGLVVLSTLFGLWMGGKFTPKDELARQLFENSRRKVRCAVCKDGDTSQASGRGACSHHGGVEHYFFRDVYSKTPEESLEEAEQISWIPSPADTAPPKDTLIAE